MTHYQQYLEFMLSTLEERAGAGVTLAETTRLVADIGLSSLEVMEFVEKIEDHFDISIPLNILPDINTLGDLARRLQDLDS